LVIGQVAPAVSYQVKTEAEKGVKQLRRKFKLCWQALYCWEEFSLAAGADGRDCSRARTVIREYVKKKPVASIDLPGVELNIGSTVNDTVEIHKIDAPDITYSYTVVGNRTYGVKPATPKVVHIID
jgi:hypothetical protein